MERKQLLPIFCGENCFVPDFPCEATELVHFRKRIGEEGVALILKESIRVNGKDSDDDNVNIDTSDSSHHKTKPKPKVNYEKIIEDIDKNKD
ncbi:MAG: hypothetical protein UZ09_BCD002001571 [Bacteroidetes bacterium OLB9]|nr:MAG: hypothetical protein UZ09_BCD002001571 [Bacteroidetes bacterium OLB9]